MSKFLAVSGFLGSGKTTLILQMAKELAARHLKVAILTNDIGSTLVDTEFLKSAGLPVYSVSGGCFCVHLDLLSDVLKKVSAELMPDVVLAEPIGSCIDLLATILKPVNAEFAGVFSVSPPAVVVDPVRLGNYLSRRANNANTSMDYLFYKQIEQADIIFLNKADTLNTDARQRLSDSLRELAPDKLLVVGVAVTGEGVGALLDEMLDKNWREWAVDIDKSIFHQADKSLGWHSVTYELKGVPSARRFMAEAGSAIVKFFHGKDVAHLKMLAMSADDSMKASFTDDSGKPGFTGAAELAGDFTLLINARIEGAPSAISAAIFSAIEGTARKHKAKARRIGRK